MVAHGQMSAHCGDVCLGHVHGHGLDACSGGFESFPERFQCIGTFAFTDEDNGPAVQVKNHRQVSMSVTNADLIDGNPMQPGERRTGEVSLKVPFLDLFDRMPTDSQMMSHIRHGHVFRELQDVSLEPLRVSAIRLGKADLHLPSHPTSQTEHPLDGKLDDRRLSVQSEES